MTRRVKQIESFSKFYNMAENLMSNEAFPWNDRVMKLPTRPWYRRIWTWVSQRTAK